MEGWGVCVCVCDILIDSASHTENLKARFPF